MSAKWHNTSNALYFDAISRSDVMCVLYKLFVPKGSGHNSFDIFEWTNACKMYCIVQSTPHHQIHRTTFSSRPFRRIARNKIELSFGDFHSMCNVVCVSYVDDVSPKWKWSWIVDAKSVFGLPTSYVKLSTVACSSRIQTTSNKNIENSQCIIPCLLTFRTRCNNLYSQHGD